MTCLLMLNPTRHTHPNYAVGSLYKFGRQINNGIVRFGRIITTGRDLRRAAVLYSGNNLVLDSPFLLSIFDRNRRRGWLQPTVGLRMLTNMKRVLGVVIHRLCT